VFFEGKCAKDWLMLTHLLFIIIKCVRFFLTTHLPPFDLKDKTVLDVGATNGEVAYWFIQVHHAAKVLCIESDPAALELLNNIKCVYLVHANF
jgi:predicted RNA methylase